VQESVRGVNAKEMKESKSPESSFLLWREIVDFLKAAEIHRQKTSAVLLRSWQSGGMGITCVCLLFIL
jgi:hypothetical protein